MLEHQKTIVAGITAIVLLFLFLMLNPFVIVSAGEKGVVLNWGAVSENILDEGLHFRMPIVQKVKIVDTKIQKEEIEAAAASKDLQNVSTKIALNYHLQADKVNYLLKNIGADYKSRIIDPAIQEAVKAATAQYTAEEVITKRTLVKEAIKSSLIDRLKKEFIIVDEVSIVNFNFSESFDSAIEAKVTAEQDALAAKNKLEQVKFEAEQRVAQAKAEAEAIKIQAQSISAQGGESYVHLKAVEKWNGVLPTQIIPNATLPFINISK